MNRPAAATATNDLDRILHAATGPARLWSVNASNHRFSGNLAEFDRRLIEALAWVDQHRQQTVTRP